MLVVLAHTEDTLALELSRRWSTHTAVVATPDDLSDPGWSWSPEAPGTGGFVAGGERFRASDVHGVLVRIHSVFEQELRRIDPAERPYVAQEMTAFLRAWLAAANCPIVNRPSSLSLCGPCWRTERWVLEANRLGIPARPTERSTSGAATPLDLDELVPVPVVGARVFAEIHPRLAVAARRLASRGRLELATIYFDGDDDRALFVGATPTADLDEPRLADAVLDRLTRVHGSAE